MLNVFVHVSSSILIAFHAAHACAFRGRKSRHPFSLADYRADATSYSLDTSSMGDMRSPFNIMQCKEVLKYPVEVQKEAAIAFLPKLLSSTHLAKMEAIRQAVEGKIVSVSSVTF